MLLMIDNYDSFTYNLVQYFEELGTRVRVFRNDEIDLIEVARLAPNQIVISPGPCTPNEAGISVSVIREFAGKIPILGVCLGHQSIAAAFGGKVVRAKSIMHGKTSDIYHDGKGLFRGIESPFTATRYHSLVAERDSLPEVLDVTAWTDRAHDHEIMGLSLRQTEKAHAPLVGVQFHPESILTTVGKQILANFISFDRS